MKAENNDRSAYDPSLAEGDFVEVRFNANLQSGFFGFVVSATAKRLRLKAHGALGEFVTDREPCLNHDLVIPMSSLAWVRHIPSKPADCDCKEGLS